jgi:DNA-binding CsgD family transcriptional regulator
MIRGQTRYLARGESGAPVPEAFASDYALTPREREIVAAVAEGLSNAQIAESQYVSLKTVETHLYNVYRKVGVKNRVGLVNALAPYRSGGHGAPR